MLSCMLIQQQMEPKMYASCALLLLLCGTQQLVITRIRSLKLQVLAWLVTWACSLVSHVWEWGRNSIT